MANFNGYVRGGSLNLRETCNKSSERLASIPNGTNLTVNTDGATNAWFKTTYNGTTGYVMAEFIAITSGVPLCTVTTESGSLNIRQTPSTSAEKIYSAAKGSSLYLLDHSSVAGWYRVSSSSGTGWGSASYLTIGDSNSGDGDSGDSDSGNTGSSGNASDDFSDDVNTNPTVITEYDFDPDKAVAYALKHSSNVNENSAGEKVADPKRNTSFREGASNACANFVHQCLLAGGARMFDGWCYKLTGIPSAWNSESWTYTNKGRRRLLEKKWIERIPATSVEPGDIIYTYYSDYQDRDMKTPFNHVTIAVTKYDSSIGGCYVCGHTTNQNTKKKVLNVDKNPYAYCYRMKAKLGGDGSEKEIDLTPGASKAI